MTTLGPGPGGYQTKSTCFEYSKPRFFMGTRLSPLKGMLVRPGPGSHDPNMSQTKYGSPAFSIKAKLGSSMRGATLAPGPGNYPPTVVNKRTSPRYGFGSSTRDTGKKMNLNVPGPGAYKLNNTVGSVPDYAIPNRTQEQKYV